MSKTKTKSAKPTVIDGKAELVVASQPGKKLQGELSVWEQKIQATGQRINTKLEDLAYDIVEFGFYLLKIREIYRLSFPEAGKRKSLSHVGQAEEGFKAWLETRQADLPRSSAYNYMNAALNCGLTENSTEEHLRQIRDKQLLSGKRLTDLYKKPKAISAGDEKKEPEQLELNLVTETLKNNYEVCDQLIKLRDEMTEEQFQTAVDRLHETLEKLTGAEWDMVDAKPTKEVRVHGS